MLRPQYAFLIAALLAATGPVLAAPIASSTFDTSAEGWTNGDFNLLSTTAPVTYDLATGTITVTDNYLFNGLIAPSAYTGNKSAAFGGTITFQLSEPSTDGVNYSPLALIGAGLTLYAKPALPPGTALTSYSVTLTGAGFYTGDPYNPAGSTAVTDSQLQSVLASLDRLAIQADWHDGSDLVRLDNVVLSGASTPPTDVPEPASIALLAAGMLGMGAFRRAKA